MGIRKIKSREIDLVAGLFDQYRMFYRQPSDPELAREFVRARLENNDSIIFVALFEEDGETIPAGFTQLYPSYSSIRAVKDWILNDLFVHPAYRNRNIGTALVRMAMEFAREQGAQRVELTTATDNLTAQKLYERMGFIKQEPDTTFLTYHLFLDIQNLKT